MKILVTIILGFGACVSSYAQKWKPDFLLPLSPESARLNNVDLASYLQSDFDAHRYEQNCVAELSLFYFRVNYEGKIDSVYSNGTLNKEAVTAVYKNIYKTQGKWKIPTGTSPIDNCWFVYPYFLFGNMSDCKENQEILYSMHSLYQFLSASKTHEDWKGRVVLPPNPHANLSYK